MASWMRYRGATVEFIGASGADVAGGWAARELRDRGVDTSRVIATGATPIVVSATDTDDSARDRRLIVDQGGPLRISREHLEKISPGDMLHVPCFMLYREDLRDLTISILNEANKRQALISLDLNSAVGMRRFGIDALASLLEKVRPWAILMNSEEYAAIRLRSTALKESICIIHRGPAATLVRGRGGDHSRPVEPADVIDSTGAGDAFAAGFLWASMRGMTLLRAVDEGHALASQCLGLVGGSSPLQR